MMRLLWLNFTLESERTGISMEGVGYSKNLYDAECYNHFYCEAKEQTEVL